MLQGKVNFQGVSRRICQTRSREKVSVIALFNSSKERLGLSLSKFG